MAFELSFAGVPFLHESRFQEEMAKLVDLLEKRIDLEDLRETLLSSDRQDNPYRIDGLATPFWPRYPNLRIGEFFYPTGAMRWARFHGLVNTTAMKSMKYAAFS